MPVTVGGSPITPTQAEQLREALGIDPEPITARLTTLVGTDDVIALRASVPHLASLAAVATYTGGAPAATAPAAFTAGQWTATVLSSTSIEVNLTALPSDGGSAITALQYRLNGGAAVTFSGTATGARTISGLTASTAYDIEVRAVNAVGNGAWSDVKNRTTSASATAPAAFTAGQWTATAGATSIVVNITALPSDGGSAITALQYRLDGGSPVAFSGTGTGSRTITGLTASVEYDVEIRAVNAVGSGAWSDLKSATPTAGSSASYIDHGVFLASGGTATVTVPGGVLSTDTLIAIACPQNDGVTNTAIATMTASGWTVQDTSAQTDMNARVFSAPGNVSTLSFTASGLGSVVLIAVRGSVRAAAVSARYWGFMAEDHTAPAVTAGAGDLVVSVFSQTSGADPALGTPQAGYTRQLLRTSELPWVSILSQAGVASGTTGTIAHGGGVNFTSRVVATIAVQA
jgi:hypothetical protein